MQEYTERLSHYTRFELLELPESGGRKVAADKAKADESRAILSKLGPRDWLVALDEHGKALDSVELSRFVQRAQSQSRDLLFAIGGDEGLGADLLASSHLRLSLSRLTLPHRLARLVLVEQLYRAFTLLRGEPYHK